MKRMGKGLLVKAVTFLTVISFMFQNVVWAQELTGFRSQAPGPGFGEMYLQPPELSVNLDIPDGLGKISDTFKGKDERTIINIVDTHANYEVQKNYARILESLIARVERNNPGKPSLLIAIEGASGRMDPSLFRNIENKAIKDILSDHFMRKGYINGAEYFSIYNTGSNCVFWGVDDRELYLRNKGLFNEVYEFRTNLEEFIDSSLRFLKQSINRRPGGKDSMGYKFVEGLIKYHTGKEDLIGYSLLLNKLITEGEQRFNNISLMSDLMSKEEGIDYDLMLREREGLIENLKGVMVEEDLKDLIEESLRFKAGMIGGYRFYTEIVKLAESYDLIKDIPNIVKYVELLNLYNKIDHKELLDEIGLLERELIDSLFKGSKNHKTVWLIYKLVILKKLNNLELTRNEWRYFEENKSDFSPDRIYRGILSLSLTNAERVSISAPPEDGEEMAILENYYKVVQDRDEVMLANTLSKMEEQGIKAAVLVSGGFHIEGITEKLKEKGISYITISPKGGSSGDDCYMDVMLHRLSPLERLITQQGTRLAVAAALAESGFDTQNIQTLEKMVGFLKTILEETFEVVEPELLDRLKEPLVVPVEAGGRRVSVVIAKDLPSGVKPLEIMTLPEGKGYIYICSEEYYELVKLQEKSTIGLYNEHKQKAIGIIGVLVNKFGINNLKELLWNIVGNRRKFINELRKDNLLQINEFEAVIKNVSLEEFAEEPDRFLRKESLYRKPEGLIKQEVSGVRISYVEDLSEVLKKAKDEKVVSRLFKTPVSDSTVELWKKPGDEKYKDHKKTIKNALGWLNVVDWMDEGKQEEITRFKEKIKKDGIEDIVLFGMGGSSLCVKTLGQIFGTDKPRLHVCDRTHPEVIKKLEDEIDPRSTLFIIASKSGSLGTIEVIAGSKYFFYERLRLALQEQGNLDKGKADEILKRLAKIEKEIAGKKVTKDASGEIAGLPALPDGMFAPRMDWEGRITKAKDEIKVEAYLALRLALDILGADIIRNKELNKDKWDEVVTEVRKNFAGITDEYSLLDYMGRGYFGKVFLNDPKIGGRYSVLSFFGMVPAGLLGIDIKKLLDNGGQVAKFSREEDLEDNPAVKLGLVLGKLWKDGRNKLNVNISKGLGNMFGLWYEQLNNESTGKDGKAFVVNANEDLSDDPNVYGKDTAFLYIKLKGDKDAATESKLEALKEKGFPVIEIELADKEAVGGLFYMLEIATAVLGHVMGIDPFDQPGVQKGKDITQEVLRGERKPKPTVETKDGITMSVSEKLLKKMWIENLSDYTFYALLKNFLSLANDGEYFAELVYTDKDELEWTVWSDLRHAVRDYTRKPVMLGVGPIYQHSNGQMYNDGSPVNIIMIMDKSDKKIDVPGMGYDFGTLFEAQVEGNKQGYDEKGRNIIRIDIDPAKRQRQIEIIEEAINKVKVLDYLESPDMDLKGITIPHEEVNEYIRDVHELNRTRFVHEGKIKSIAFDDTGNPVLSDGKYTLVASGDANKYARLLDKVNEAKAKFQAMVDALLDEVGISGTERTAKKELLNNIIFVFVKGELFVGKNKDIIAHAGRRRNQITLGELLIDLLTSDEIAKLMSEEAKHILMPSKGHKSSANPDGIGHDEIFISAVKAKADEYLSIKNEEDLRKLYFKLGVNRTRGSPWLRMYLNSPIVKDPKLRTALGVLLSEFDNSGYDPKTYFEKIEDVFEKYYGFRPSVNTNWTEDDAKVQQVLQYHRAINPEFWQNYSFVRDTMYKGNDCGAITAYLNTVPKTGFKFAKVVCGIVEAEDAQRPLDPAGAGKVIRGPPKSTDFTYIGGGGWTPTDFGWLFTAKGKYAESKLGEIVVTLISNTQDDGGRTRELQDAIRRLWNLYTIAAGDGVILPWITANLAKLFLLYKDFDYNRTGDLSRVFNIKKLKLTDKDLIDWLFLPLKKGKVFDRKDYDIFIKDLLDKQDMLTKENLEQEIINSAKIALSSISGKYTPKKIEEKQKQAWKQLKTQVRLTGEHLLDVESVLKEMIMEAVDASGKNKDVEFEGRSYGKDYGLGYEIPNDWLYFVGTILSLARMANRELLASGINDFQNMSWMNTYTILGLLASRMIQRGNPKAGIKGTMHNDKISTMFFNEMFGIENGFWAPSTYEETTMGMLCEGVGIKLTVPEGEGKRDIILAVGKREDGKIVIGKQHEFDMARKMVQTTTKLERLVDQVEFTVDEWKEYPNLPIEVKLSNRGTGLIRFNNQVLELDNFKDEEGKTTVSIDGKSPIRLRTDARWQEGLVTPGGGWELQLKSQLVEEQTRITDTDELHVTPIKKLIWKRAVLDKDGKVIYDEYGHRQYRNTREDEKPKTDPVALELLRNTRKLVLTAQSSLVTSTLPNYLTVGLVDALKELRKKGIPVIYLLKPATDIETLGLTYSEQLKMMERSIQDFMGDPNFRITEIFSHVIIPDIDTLSEKTKLEFEKSFRKKKEEFTGKLPGVYSGVEKMSKIMPMGPLSITYKNKDYPGKKEDMEYLKQLRKSGVEVVWSQRVRVFQGKYVYDEEGLIDDCLSLSRILRFKAALRNGLGRGINFISEWHQIFKKLEDQNIQNIWPDTDVSVVTVGFDKGNNQGYKYVIKVPGEAILAQDKELRDMVLRYLSIYIYNRLATLGAEGVYISVQGKEKVENSLIGRFLVARFSFDRKLIKIVAEDRTYPDRPYKLIYNYISRVNESELEVRYVDKSVIDSLQEMTPSRAVAVEKTKGAYIGVDIGGTDVKIIAVKEGEIVFSEENNWEPQNFKKVDEHMVFLTGRIDEAIKALGLNEKETISGIGIGVNLAVNNDRVTGLGPLVEGIEKTGDDEEIEKIKKLSELIGSHYNVPVAIANDGDMAALWAAQDMGLKNVLCLAMGTGLATGYVDENGSVLDILGEMGNVVVDMSEKAAPHSFTNMQGVLQAYLSQRPVIGEGGLAEQAGIYLKSIAFNRYRELSGWRDKFYGAKHKKKTGEIKLIENPEDMDKVDKALLLEVAQDLLINGTREQREKMSQIFEEIGKYLAEAIIEIGNYLKIEDVMIMGRVSKDRGGDIIKNTAENILRAKDINNIGIHFPEAPAGSMKDVEWYKKFGQAMGTVYLIMQKNQGLARLKREDMRGQMMRLYGKKYEEAQGLGADKFANVGFEKDKKGEMINRMGWTVENVNWLLANPDKVKGILEDAKKIRGEYKEYKKYKYVIFCGMGGSGLSVQTVKETFGEPEGLKIFSLRTTDPAVINDILNEITKDAGSLKKALENTLVIPISKSGTTEETVKHKEYFEGLFNKVFNDSPKIKEHMWVITDKGSPMDTGDYEQREIQLNGLEDIGGRFTSSTTNIFLLPLALVAPDMVWEVLKLAKEMNEIEDINKDTFIKLGVFLYYMAKDKGKDKVTFLVPEELRQLPFWAEQLFEESLGKEGKGVTLFYGENINPNVLKIPEKNDRVFLRINLGEKETKPELWDYLTSNNYPTFEINVEDINAIGGVMLGLQRAVATIAYLWDICFVDQPAVQGYKERTKKIMDSLQPGQMVEVPKEWKYIPFNKLELYYSPLIDAGGLTEEELKAEVERLDSNMENAPAVYAAIINILKSKPGFEAAELTSYGRMTKELKGIMRDVRYDIFTKWLRMPSKLGEGPDKNHSYQQNIEGGKNMFFSTYILPLNLQQPEILPFNENLLKAQTIGTINSMVDKKRKVVLITAQSDMKSTEPDIKEFFDKVKEYLLKGHEEIPQLNLLAQQILMQLGEWYGEEEISKGLPAEGKVSRGQLLQRWIDEQPLAVFRTMIDSGVVSEGLIKEKLGETEESKLLTAAVQEYREAQYKIGEINTITEKEVEILLDRRKGLDETLRGIKAEDIRKIIAGSTVGENIADLLTVSRMSAVVVHIQSLYDKVNGKLVPKDDAEKTIVNLRKLANAGDKRAMVILASSDSGIARNDMLKLGLSGLTITAEEIKGEVTAKSILETAQNKYRFDSGIIVGGKDYKLIMQAISELLTEGAISQAVLEQLISRVNEWCAVLGKVPTLEEKAAEDVGEARKEALQT